MGRLIPAGTGMEYYRSVKIAGEDVVEEEPIYDADAALAGDLSVYDDEARTVYAGGLSEEPGPEENSGGIARASRPVAFKTSCPWKAGRKARPFCGVTSSGHLSGRHRSSRICAGLISLPYGEYHDSWLGRYGKDAASAACNSSRTVERRRSA